MVTSAKKSNGKKGGYTLTIPLDASQVDSFTPEQSIRVAARHREGQVDSKVVRLDQKGQGTVEMRFNEHPGPLQIVLGPESATEEELFALQTLRLSIGVRQWQNEPQLTLPPVRIPAYHWHWWLRWCRTFTIHGRVVCPDGSAVPGAKVCAYDVDWWFFWSSQQEVGCATTDINGAFSLTFRWCCGWWPWWWWRNRRWQLNPDLVERVTPILQGNTEFQLGRVGNQPSLQVFDSILSADRHLRAATLKPEHMDALPQIRNELLSVLPKAPQLTGFRIWPWYPWYPWWDCTPDILFKVSQDCGEGERVILEEGIGDTRWNIDNPLEVTLTTTGDACCIPVKCPNEPCEEGECLILDEVCHYPMDRIGGNPGAAATPEGYVDPGPVPVNTAFRHRPFSGIVPIYKNPGDLLGVDYYELEVNDGSGWEPLETSFPGAAEDFKRTYLETATGSSPNVDFPLVFISGHWVYQTRERYETVSGMTWDLPGADAWWLSPNWNLLAPINTAQIPDGTLRFRVVAWQLTGPDTLGNSRVLPICGTDENAELVLTVDNRKTDLLSHDTSHNCGEGVHICTPEPDTHILEVRIDGESVGPCDTVGASSGILEIDFEVSDPDGHLANYVLRSQWGLNQSRTLLDRPGASVSPITGTAYSGWQVGQNTGNYGTALSQGATAPHWYGGRYRLTVPVAEAFPEPCCYQLELVAHKRTVIGRRSGIRFLCSGNYRNVTQYSLGVGVCHCEEDEAAVTIAESAELQHPSRYFQG